MAAIIYPFMAMADLPNRIREWRKSRKMTLLDLSLSLSCSVAQVSELERGVVPLTLDWMIRLADALDIGVSDILRPEHVGGALSADERDLVQRYRSGDDNQRNQMRVMSEVIIPFRAESDDEAAPRVANG